MLTIQKAGTTINRFIWYYMDANMYGICEGKDLLIIDPVDTKEVWQFLEQKDPNSATILLTHEHFDHINGLNRMRDTLPCRVYAQSKCSENIGNPKKNLSNITKITALYMGTEIPDDAVIPRYHADPADAVFKEKLAFCWHDHRIEMIATPGHSPGSACIVWDGKILFSGDTLLRKPVVTRFPGGNTEQYEKITIPLLESLAGQIEYVLPGHWEGGKLEDMLRQSTQTVTKRYVGESRYP